MSISCEIHLFDHPNNVYSPGDKVHGFVKYTLSEETRCTGITISLKGCGNLHIRWDTNVGKNQQTTHFNNSETYVDLDLINDDYRKDISLPAGTHEIPFCFLLPENIPPSFKYKNHIYSYYVSSKIVYYVRLKFERPGLLNLDKRFKTKIIVANSATPTMSQTPVICKIEKKPFHIFKREKVLSIKGIIENSVTAPGGRVKINYEVNNETNLNSERISVKLTQETAFIMPGHEIIDSQTINVFVCDDIKSGGSKTMDLIMEIPSGLGTMQHSKLVSRNYFINIIAKLPFPHRDAVMKMPIEVMEHLVRNPEAVTYDDPPPSYSEVMAEYKKEDLKSEYF